MFLGEAFIYYILEHLKFYLTYKYILGTKFQNKRLVPFAVLMGSIIMAYSVISLEEKFMLILYVPILLLESIVFIREKMLYTILIALWALCVNASLDSITESCVYIFREAVKVEGLQLLKFSLVNSIITLLVLGVMSVLLKNKFSYKNISIKYYVFFVIIAFANAIVLSSLTGTIREDQQLAHKISVAIIFMIVTIGAYMQLVMIMYLSVTKKIYMEKDELNRMYQKTEKEHFAYLEKREEETRRFRHDIRDHLDTVYKLAQMGENEKTKMYLENMVDKVESFNMKISVNDSIADAIINQYASICEQKNIKFIVRGHFPSEIHIEPMDMCTILSNILRNAVEAAEKSAEKQIELNIRYEEKEELIVLNLKNSSPDGIDFSRTSKKDNNNHHGYGLLNIDDTIKKYKGKRSIHVSEQLVNIMISIQN